MQEIKPPNTQFQEQAATSAEALSHLESSVMLGQLALVASHLVEKGSSEGMPDTAWYKVEGAREELKNGSESAEYVEGFIGSTLDVFDLLQQTGDTDKAADIVSDLAYSLGKETTSHFSEAFERGLVSDEQAYRLMSSISQSGNYRGTLFFYITGKKSFEYVPREGEDDVRSALADRMFQKSLEDDTPEGELVRQMFGDYLSNGLSDVDRSDIEVKTPDMMKKLLVASGFEDSQTAEVFDAITQSKGEKYGYSINERLNGTMRTLNDLRVTSKNIDDFKQKVAQLYGKFGIRNFYRYTASDLEPQLDSGFKPDSVVVTAFSDEGGALAKPSNSAEGLQYKNPVYFEASQSIDIAKSLLRAHKLAGSPLDKVLIRAHGSPEGFLLSRTAKYGIVDTIDLDARGTGSGWESRLVSKGVVSSDAEVVFESCSLGAGNFPKSLYTRTGVDKILTSPANIVGSAVLGTPGVVRGSDGSVKFGISAPDFTTKTRPADGLADAVAFDRS
jgi:hypothetical protein